jgi:hypothetical protein
VTSPVFAFVVGPPVPAGVEPAWLDLTVQGNRFTGSMVPPQVAVNGWLLNQDYGRRMVPVPPGYVRVDAWTPTWLGSQFGRAAVDLMLAPGQVAPVFYALPYQTFSPGSIGPGPQERRGLLGLVLVLAPPVLAALVPLSLVVWMLVSR